MTTSGWLRRGYERFGQFAYAANWFVEARLRGLRSHQIMIEGMPLNYLEGGPQYAEGTIILLHGFTADRRIWIRFAGHLLGTYRVIIPDLPGHGETPFRSGLGYSGPAQARRVIALMDMLGARKAHVYGNSMGGFITAHLALNHPGRIATAGLSDAAGVTGRAPSELDLAVAAGDNPFLIDSPAGFDRLYPLTMNRPPFNPAPARAGLARDYIERRESYAEIFSDFYLADLLGEQELSRISVPVLIIWGELDQLVDLSAARILHRMVPGAELTVYQDIGHMPMLEVPGRAASDYFEFLQRHQRGGGSA